MIKAGLIFHLAGFTLFLLASISPNRPVTALAQVNLWSPQERIPYYDDDAPSPFLVADRNCTVHAFNSQAIGDTPVILYSQWTLEQGWTAPVDILLLPGSSTYTELGAFLDRTGMMHLAFWTYTSDEGASIYYSSAPAINAASARAWSFPVLVGQEAASPGSVALTGDDEGNLYLVYSSKGEGLGLYAVHSPDAGHTWSQPTSFFLTGSETLWPFEIHMDLNDQDQLHVVWSVVNAEGLGEAVYYARLETDHLQWSTPVLLAERDKGDYKADWPCIIARHNEIFVVYQDSFPATRWFRHSVDGGETWTDPIRPFEYVGEYYQSVLLMDSNATLHLILGNRIPHSEAPATHGMWHSVWQGDRWSELEAIVSRSEGKGFDPTGPQAVISQGNILLVTWTTDPMAGLNGVWYSYSILNAPELPIVPLPTLLATPTATPISTVTPPVLPATASPSRVLINRQVSDSALMATNPTLTLVAAIVPVILLISAAIVVRQVYHHGLH
ncbi:MAG: hypothetical protein KJ077_03585 [Anaerolineae bacterium]|nr:hypothetical protein [Anaerolineae bacterium]